MTYLYKKNTLATCIALALGISYLGPVSAAEEPQEENTNSNVELGTLRVTGQGVADTAKTENTESYTAGTMNTATKLDLSIRETPASVSVMTRTQMDDFGLTSLNGVLHNTTGINVVEVETDRTTYNARGFQIDNFLVDGLGQPLTDDILHGEMDTAILDRVEVLRGSSALLTGVGNPSATVNQIRKRPTPGFQAHTAVSLGSWNGRRVDADISGSVTESGATRGRLVAAQESSDSYIDRYSHDRSVFYGVIEHDLSIDTTITAGYSLQQNDVDGSMSGGVPLFYSDGTETNYDVNVSSAPDWAFWNTEDERAFVELAHYFSNSWSAKAVFNRIENSSDAEQMYLWFGGGVDPVTQLGGYIYTGSYVFEKKQNLVDIFASGPFNLLGREHEMVFGISLAKAFLEEQSMYDENYATLFPYDLSTWNGAYPKGLFTNPGGSSDVEESQKSAYMTLRLNATDTIKVIPGFRVSKWEMDGESYGNNISTEHDNVITPFLGMMVDVTDNLSAYASYAESFTPQSAKDYDGNYLDPKEGKNYEIGMKGAFNENRLFATLTYFKVVEDNVAELRGFSPVTVQNWFTGVEGATSKGIEGDFSGEIIKDLEISFGFNRLFTLEDSEGNKVNLFIPRTTFRTSAVYRIPSMKELKVGASVNWQSEISRAEGVGDIVSKQEAYTLINLMSRYEFSDEISLTFNINNITDKKYLTTMQYAQSHYGAPRNYAMTLRWDY